MGKGGRGRRRTEKFHQPPFMKRVPSRFQKKDDLVFLSKQVPRVFKPLQPNISPDKIFIVDTSVLLHDPESIEHLASKDNLVIIMTCVIQELDHFKTLQNDPIGYAAREATRKMEHYQLVGNCLRGVKTKMGGHLVFVDADMGNYEGADEILIEFAQSEVIKQIKARSVAIVSKDTNLRVKARAKGIIAEDYNTDKVLVDPQDILTKFSEFEVPLEKGNFKERKFGEEEKISLLLDDDVLPRYIDISKLSENQCCKIILKDSNNELFTIFKKSLGGFSLFSKKECKRIKPRNDEQFFALALLFDPTIELVALPGKAGTGKTLLSLYAGFEQLQTYYQKIIVYRPIVSVGQDLGFLPGDESEKFSPWKAPITDNFNLILGVNEKTDGEKSKKGRGGSCKDFEQYNQLEISPYTYIRGRSVPNVFMIIDEAQNIPPKDIKTIVSRAGQSTKVVVIGDPEQIDHHYLDRRSNGLIVLMQKMRHQEIFGAITLVKSERSGLSDLVASLM